MSKSVLLSPITIGRTTFKNRVFMSPMCMYACTNQDGILDKKRFDHYTARAAGGVGAIVVEATGVNPQAGISAYDLFLHNDQQEAALKELVDSVHFYGTKIGIQLGHAGRKGSGYAPLVAPSAVAFDANSQTPTELTQEQIYQLVADFKQAGQRAVNAGFDFIEIHGAHGYLISQFISPLANKRTDEFGGSLEKRYQFLKLIIQELKTLEIDLHLRISANEIEPEGNSIQDLIKLCQWAKEDGVVFFDISSGGITPVPPTIYPGYQANLAKEFASQGLDVGAVGLLDKPELAEYVLREGLIKVIYLGRALLRNPNWLYQAAYELHDQPEFALEVYGRAGF